jgi:hypothetical protein
MPIKKEKHLHQPIKVTKENSQNPSFYKQSHHLQTHHPEGPDPIKILINLAPYKPFRHDSFPYKKSIIFFIKLLLRKVVFGLVSDQLLTQLCTFGLMPVTMDPIQSLPFDRASSTVLVKGNAFIPHT